MRRLCCRKSPIAAASAIDCSLGTIETSGPNTSFSSRPPGLSLDSTGVPDASASTATVGSASRIYGSTTVGGGAIARDRRVIDHPGKRDMAFDPADRATDLRFFEHLACAADDEPRVREQAVTSFMLRQKPLPGERMKPFYIQQQVGVVDAERRRISRCDTRRAN